MNIGELDKAERIVWTAGREIQAGIPRWKGLCLRQVAEKTGFSVCWVSDMTDSLEEKGLAKSQKIGARRKKGTIRFLKPTRKA